MIGVSCDARRISRTGWTRREERHAHAEIVSRVEERRHLTRGPSEAAHPAHFPGEELVGDDAQIHGVEHGCRVTPSGIEPPAQRVQRGIRVAPRRGSDAAAQHVETM